MSKIPKQPEKKQKTKEKYRSDENFAFRSIIISAILGCISFIVSLLFNAEIITVFMNIDLLWTFIDISIKVIPKNNHNFFHISSETISSSTS